MATSRDHLIRACEHLGIPYQEGFGVRTSDGQSVESDIFIPQFSHHMGMLVFDSARYCLFHPYSDELLAQGYSGTSWNLNTQERTAFELDRFIEMFSEWGWCGDADKQPDWVKPYDLAADEAQVEY